MALALWFTMLALMGCGWFLRSVARRFSNLGHRQKTLLIAMYAVWAAVVMILMLWIGTARMNTVGPLFVPVMVILAALAAFSDDIGRLVRRVSASKRND
jgi:hypothetical protein